MGRGSGRVDIQDLIAFNSGGAYGTGQADAAWWQSDFNDDGRVNVSDLMAVVSSGLYGGGAYQPQDTRAATESTPPSSRFALAGAPASVQGLDPFTWAALANQAEAETVSTRKTNRFRLLGQG